MSKEQAVDFRRLWHFKGNFWPEDFKHKCCSLDVWTSTARLPQSSPRSGCHLPRFSSFFGKLRDTELVELVDGAWHRTSRCMIQRRDPSTNPPDYPTFGSSDSRYGKKSQTYRKFDLGRFPDLLTECGFSMVMKLVSLATSQKFQIASLPSKRTAYEQCWKQHDAWPYISHASMSWVMKSLTKHPLVRRKTSQVNTSSA